MKDFARIHREYHFSGGLYQSKAEPSDLKKAVGFKPTFISIDGSLSPGDAVEVAELNYIFNDLYGKAEQIDKLLTAKGK